MIETYVFTFCRMAIGLMFLISFVGKVRNPALFAMRVKNLRIFPGRYSTAIAFSVIAAEIAIPALLLADGFFTLIGLSVAAILLLAFSIVLALVLWRNISTPCNCFGASERPISIFELYRNLGFIILLVVALWLKVQLGVGQTSLATIALIPLGLAATVFVIIWINIPEVTKLWQR